MDRVTRPEHLPEQSEQLLEQLEQLPEQLEQLAEQPKQLLEQPEQFPDKLELQSMMMAVTKRDAIWRRHGQRCLSSPWNLACRKMEHWDRGTFMSRDDDDPSGGWMHYRNSMSMFVDSRVQPATSNYTLSRLVETCDRWLHHQSIPTTPAFPQNRKSAQD